MTGTYSLVISLFVLWVLFGNRQVDEFFEGSQTA